MVLNCIFLEDDETFIVKLKYLFRADHEGTTVTYIGSFGI